MVGKVTDIEKDVVKTKDGGEFTIASVKIAEGYLGTKGLTHVKVGFVPNTRGGGSLQAGQEVCLFLQKYPGENFYTATMYFDTIQKQDNPNFAKEAAEAKKYAEYITKVDEYLKSTDAKERYLAAAMTIVYHRSARTGTEKTKELDAALSKQLLEALRDADWKNPNTITPTLQPVQVFMRLQLTKEDGWIADLGGDLSGPAKKWLEINAGKYRIKSFQAEDKK